MWKWNCTFVHFSNCKQTIQRRDEPFTTAFSPCVIPGNYPLQIFLLFVLTVHADGSIIPPTIDSSLVKVWPSAILLDDGPSLRIVLDRAQWLKARKSPMGLPLISTAHSFLNVVIRAQFCGAGWTPVSCSFRSVLRSWSQALNLNTVSVVNKKNSFNKCLWLLSPTPPLLKNCVQPRFTHGRRISTFHCVTCIIFILSV